MQNPFNTPPKVDQNNVAITGGTIDNVAITSSSVTGGTTAPSAFVMPEGTPTNAIAASGAVTFTGLPNVFVPSAFSTGTITVNGTPVENETFVVGTQTFTFKALRAAAGEVTIDADNTQQAVNIVAAMTLDIFAEATATNLAGVVTVTAATAGVAGDAVTLTENATGIEVSAGGTLTGGVDEVLETVTIGAQVFTFVTLRAFAGDVTVGIDAVATAANFAIAVNADTAVVTAYASEGVVLITAATKGTLGNAIVFTENATNTAVSAGGTLSGGVDGTVAPANTTFADTDYIYHTPVANTVSGANWEKVALGATVPAYHGVESIGTVTFSNTYKTLNISGSMIYWYKGVRVITALLTCDLDSVVDRDHASATLTTNTLYYFYFKDATGKLYWSPVAWDLKETVPVATVFWTGTAGAIHKEWHNYTRDLDWHINSHLTIGARYLSGLDLTKPTTAFDANLDLTTGYIYDEDLLFTITNPTTARAWYKASAGVYTFADISLPYTGTSGDCAYLDTDTYTLTSATASKYICYWVYGSGDIDRPIYIIPTHAAAPYNTVALARAETVPALSGFGLNPELKLLYRFIYRGDGEFQEAADYRLSSSLPIGAVPTPAASSVTVVPSGNIASINVQAAIEELDAERNSFDAYVEAATDTLTASQCYGGQINNYGQSGNVVLALPAVTAGMSFTWVAGSTAAFYYRIDPDANDKIILDGVAGSDGKYIGLASVTQGDWVYFRAIQTGAGAYDWMATSGLGAFVAEA